MAAARSRNGCGRVSLCLASAGLTKALSVAAFTLVWTHSIEKVDWQEDWQVGRDGLTLVAARIKGSGAGMEPPPEARLVDGWYRWTPHTQPRREVMLGNSATAGEWRFCIDGACRTLSDLLGRPVGANPTTMSVCGDIKTASTESAVAPPAKRPDANDLVAQGDAFIASGDQDRAIVSYSEAIALNPKAADIYNKRGEAYRAIGDRPHAIADFAAAMRLDPQHTKAQENHRALARDLERLGVLMGVTNRQSFDCKTTKEVAEKAICASALLSRLDRDINAVFSKLVGASERDGRAAAEALRTQQREFVVSRNASFGKPGFDLRKAMTRRLEELLAIDRN